MPSEVVLEGTKGRWVGERTLRLRLSFFLEKYVSISCFNNLAFHPAIILGFPRIFKYLSTKQAGTCASSDPKRMNLVASQGLGTWVYVFGKIEQTKEEEKAWVPTEEAPPTGGTSCVLRLECGHRL